MSRLDYAAQIMTAFGRRTGLTEGTPSRRYLWTDAFAVCNLLGLAAAGHSGAADQARALVDAVHRHLGRHRADDPRNGWISGLDEDEGAAHPTVSGLRIGKPLPEREPGAPADPRLEWEQDGQYFHYLTRWMHALSCTAHGTGDATYLVWARELASTAFRAFSYRPGPGAPRRMYWKMSIDLRRPLVNAMGQLDPLDGYVTLLELATARPGPAAEPDLGQELAALAHMVESGDWATDDPLGLGGLMTDVHQLEVLETRGAAPLPGLTEALLRDIEIGLTALHHQQPWRAPAGRRLGFRELGLAIGLAALKAAAELARTAGRADRLARLEPLIDQTTADDVIDFWMTPAHQRQPTWTEHQDINEVMLATALAPQGYLTQPGASHAQH